MNDDKQLSPQVSPTPPPSSVVWEEIAREAVEKLEELLPGSPYTHYGSGEAKKIILSAIAKSHGTEREPIDAFRQALIEAAQIVHDKLSWVEDGQRYFSNIGALEAHDEILALASGKTRSTL